MRSFKSINPCNIEYKENGLITLKANPHTDFICKYQLYEKDSASLFYKEISGDFTVKAKLTVTGEAFGDATLLMVRATRNRWIKLCVELGVDDTNSVVSMVTDVWSDDANGEQLPANEAWVRITKKGVFFGLHYSLDGKRWRFVRAFGMELGEKVKVGFGIQAPRSQHCEGTVDHFEITDTVITDFRGGE